MTDTAQPPAAESDGFADAANAFKIALGQAEPEQRPHGPGSDEAGDYPDSLDDPDDYDVMAAADEADVAMPDDDDDDAAADPAQPDTAMPISWSKEDAALWAELPPEAQAKIAEREGQRDQAVNYKFQEAANARRVHEAAFAEAQTSRLQHAQAIEQVMGLISTHEPPLSMLDIDSSDYDPDNYHLLRARHEQTCQVLAALNQQRHSIAAQHDADQQRMEQARFHHINAGSKDAFLRDVPEATDQAKATRLFQGLIEYAVRNGAPAELFDLPTTAMEWHMIWKARQYDRLQTARARVGGQPAPVPRKAQPPVRPGVTTPRSAVERARRDKDFSRLRKSGSIEDGAAVFKHFLKG